VASRRTSASRRASARSARRRRRGSGRSGPLRRRARGRARPGRRRREGWERACVRCTGITRCRGASLRCEVPTVRGQLLVAGPPWSTRTSTGRSCWCASTTRTAPWASCSTVRRRSRPTRRSPSSARRWPTRTGCGSAARAGHERRRARRLRRRRRRGAARARAGRPRAPDADLDEVGETVARARAFLGYAGWGPGQLDGELDNDDWIVADFAADDAFTEDPEKLWAQVLGRKGGEYALLATMPPDPSQN
jgi:hypothetical protein